MAEPLKHLDASAYVEARRFKSTLMVQRPPAPARERRTHGQRLLQQLQQLHRAEADFKRRREALDLPAAIGLTVAVELRPKGLLDYKAMEWKRDGVEVLNVTSHDDFDLIVVHIPDGRLGAFEKRIREYISEDTKYGKPKHAALINVIESFRQAAFDELWTDPINPPPAQIEQWFQLWLRVKAGDPAATRRDFGQVAERMDIVVETGYVPFPGRIVVAARSTRAALEQAIELLDVMAEIRSVQPTAEFFLSDLNPVDQMQWVRNLTDRMQANGSPTAAYVTLLDTGVAQAHPLIQSSLDAADLHALVPAWNGADADGHGTQMAGIVLHGDLTQPLASNETHEVPHRLESVNIYPPQGQHPYHLYGWVTQQAVDVVEGVALDRRRTFAMMSTCTEASTGLPSEWSATIDRLAAGGRGTLEPDNDEPRQRRLFVLSGGNIPWPKWGGYPHINQVEGIESPGQAWECPHCRRLHRSDLHRPHEMAGASRHRANRSPIPLLDHNDALATFLAIQAGCGG